MTIYYFTSTGNSLSVAKRIAELLDKPSLRFSGERFGLVFPVYGFGLPRMVRDFIQAAQWQAEYSFAVGTYGNLAGAAMQNLQKLAAKNNQHFDYAASLLMVDNYLPLFDLNKQIAKLPKKDIEGNLSRIVEDIAAGTTLQAKASLFWRIATVVLQKAEAAYLSSKQAQGYLVNDNCNGCGSCAKGCPAKNIVIANDRPSFELHCIGCLGCIHLCQKNALHIKGEKNSMRFRNPTVSLAEIIKANNRTKED